MGDAPKHCCPVPVRVSAGALSLPPAMLSLWSLTQEKQQRENFLVGLQKISHSGKKKVKSAMLLKLPDSLEKAAVEIPRLCNRDGWQRTW